MKIYGLTGGIACGKSAVTKRLRESGFKVIDADEISRVVVMKGSWGWRRLRAAFGDEVFQKNGCLDRDKMGKMIFGDAVLRGKLNTALGLPIAAEIVRRMLLHWLAGETLIFLDAPTLYETKVFVSLCSKVVVVSVREDVQLKRLMHRDACDEKSARARMRAQMPVRKKVEMCDIHISNDGTFEDLDFRVTKLVQSAKRDSRGMSNLLFSSPIVMLILWASLAYCTRSVTLSITAASAGLVGISAARLMRPRL